MHQQNVIQIITKKIKILYLCLFIKTNQISINDALNFCLVLDYVDWNSLY